MGGSLVAPRVNPQLSNTPPSTNNFPTTAAPAAPLQLLARAHRLKWGVLWRVNQHLFIWACNPGMWHYVAREIAVRLPVSRRASASGSIWQGTSKQMQKEESLGPSTLEGAHFWELSKRRGTSTGRWEKRKANVSGLYVLSCYSLHQCEQLSLDRQDHQSLAFERTKRTLANPGRNLWNTCCTTECQTYDSNRNPTNVSSMRSIFAILIRRSEQRVVNSIFLELEPHAQKNCFGCSLRCYGVPNPAPCASMQRQLSLEFKMTHMPPMMQFSYLILWLVWHLILSQVLLQTTPMLSKSCMCWSNPCWDQHQTSALPKPLPWFQSLIGLVKKVHESWGQQWSVRSWLHIRGGHVRLHWRLSGGQQVQQSSSWWPRTDHAGPSNLGSHQANLFTENGLPILHVLPSIDYLSAIIHIGLQEQKATAQPLCARLGIFSPLPRLTTTLFPPDLSFRHVPP